MKRTMILALALALLAGPVLAGAARLVRVEGYVVDSWCGKANANDQGADCVVECNKKGADLVFYTSKGKIYDLADQKDALGHIGQKMVILGTVDSEGSLKVGSWKPATKPATAEEKPVEGS